MAGPDWDTTASLSSYGRTRLLAYGQTRLLGKTILQNYAAPGIAYQYLHQFASICIKTDRSNRRQDKTAGLRQGRTIVKQDWDTTASLWLDQTGTWLLAYGQTRLLGKTICIASTQIDANIDATQINANFNATRPDRKTDFYYIGTF
jgi:hypothetical protein